MRAIILLFLLALPLSAFAEQGVGVEDKISFQCEREGRALNFELSRATRVAVFTSLSAMDYPQMPFKLPIGYIDNGTSFDITYDWYYSADYNFKLSSPINLLKPGQTIQMWLNGNDNDGSTYNNEEYSCQIL